MRFIDRRLKGARAGGMIAGQRSQFDRPRASRHEEQRDKHPRYSDHLNHADHASTPFSVTIFMNEH
ncbi:MAG TPA: hypothetical protein DIT99_21465, partial [Candidatus Latescibacteria bacterium]|nr:hypothetical protein [Candidatus Latescibacterota bacterium]